MKLISLFEGIEYELTLSRGQEVLNLSGKKDWIQDIFINKMDASVLLAIGGYVNGYRLQEYNNRFNK